MDKITTVLNDHFIEMFNKILTEGNPLDKQLQKDPTANDYFKDKINDLCERETQLEKDKKRVLENLLAAYKMVKKRNYFNTEQSVTARRGAEMVTINSIFWDSNNIIANISYSDGSDINLPLEYLNFEYLTLITRIYAYLFNAHEHRS